VVSGWGELIGAIVVGTLGSTVIKSGVEGSSDTVVSDPGIRGGTVESGSTVLIGPIVVGTEVDTSVVGKGSDAVVSGPVIKGGSVVSGSTVLIGTIVVGTFGPDVKMLGVGEGSGAVVSDPGIRGGRVGFGLALLIGTVVMGKYGLVDTSGDVEASDAVVFGHEIKGRRVASVGRIVVCT